MGPISPQNLALTNSRHRAAMLMVGVQALLVVILSAAALISAGGPRAAGDEQTITVLWIGVLFLAVSSLLLRRLLSGWERLADVIILFGVSGLLARLLRDVLITCGFGTLAAFCGFAVFRMTGDPFDMVRAGAAAFVVYVANYPRKAAWKTLVARAEELSNV